MDNKFIEFSALSALAQIKNYTFEDYFFIAATGKIRFLDKMEKLILEEDTDFPGIILDKEAGVFKITGRSIPHDTSKFYIPVIEWFREYSLNPNENTAFEFKLEYFNTSSQKYIADLFKLLDKMFKNGYKTKVVWIYQHDDDDMRDIGKEFDYIFELPFEFKEF